MPTTGVYQILAFGAQGGGYSSFDVGGRGAEIGGNFGLTEGEILEIAVGSSGNSGGGGGGSFVVGPGNVPVVIAGGGGGAGEIRGFPLAGQGGLVGQDGGGLGGGTGGNGGAPAVTGGFGGSSGGGEGFFSAGGSGLRGSGGGGFPDLTGGIPGGGFGGGGGGLGGGGGGYSGGGGAGALPSTLFPGGGGGSFDAGTNQILMADFQTGNGQVIITELTAEVPEPASMALLVGGLVSLAALWGRRRARC